MSVYAVFLWCRRVWLRRRVVIGANSKRLQPRSHGGYSTPRNTRCHVEFDPHGLAQERETRNSMGSLGSLLDENSTQCHVVCGRG